MFHYYYKFSNFVLYSSCFRIRFHLCLSIYIFVCCIHAAGQRWGKNKIPFHFLSNCCKTIRHKFIKMSVAKRNEDALYENANIRLPEAFFLAPSLQPSARSTRSRRRTRPLQWEYVFVYRCVCVHLQHL